MGGEWFEDDDPDMTRHEEFDADQVVMLGTRRTPVLYCLILSLHSLVHANYLPGGVYVSLAVLYLTQDTVVYNICLFR